MAQEFHNAKFAPVAGVSALSEAVFNEDGTVSCYFYGGYVDMSEIAFSAMEKKYTEFLDGLNELKKLEVPKAKR